MKQKPLSPEYLASIEAHNMALAEYQAALADYRALKIGDDEYIGFRQAYNKANDAFDAAFNRECGKAA